MSDGDDATRAARPGARDADTAVDEPRSDSAPAVDPRLREPTSVAYDERYTLRRTIGSGGMGEVQLCLDAKTGREVAIKVMIAPGDRRARERFLREGRVQAQLEHPGIVPVYDIGITPDGAPYMAMKRVKGVTLYEVLRALRDGDPEIQRRHPRSSLLTVVERVCETMAYAHARGVVHRDLKPANIMLGDYGEVSVLDWGVAKLAGDSDLPTGDFVQPESSEFTVPGSVIGTVAYMAPEQAIGDPVDPSADVYALGAILYEVVTLERLHRETTLDDRMSSQLKGRLDARPSQRVPGVAAELDAICVRATETLRSKRYPSAREMVNELRGFLEGERATELLREMAGRHAQAARSTLTKATASETTRITALRELGAAAVLDPNNQEMIQMIEALLEPSAQTPPEVERELESARRASASTATGRSAIAYASAIVILPALAWMGIRDWTMFGLMAGGTVASAIGAFLMSRGNKSTGIAAWIAAPFAFALVATMSSLFSSFFLVPALVVTTCVSFTISVRPSPPLRAFLVVCGLAAILGPAAAAMLGVAPPSLRFEEGVIEILPHLAAFPELPTTALLVVTSAFLVTANTLLVGGAVDSLSAAERRLAVQAHRLRAMLPVR